MSTNSNDNFNSNKLKLSKKSISNIKTARDMSGSGRNGYNTGGSQ
jgi:hypothetical protein